MTPGNPNPQIVRTLRVWPVFYDELFNGIGVGLLAPWHVLGHSLPPLAPGDVIHLERHPDGLERHRAEIQACNTGGCYTIVMAKGSPEEIS